MSACLLSGNASASCGLFAPENSKRELMLHPIANLVNDAMAAPEGAFSGEVFRLEFDQGILLASSRHEQVYLHSLETIVDFLSRDDISAGIAMDVIQKAIVNRLQFEGESPLMAFRKKKQDSFQFSFPADKLFRDATAKKIQVAMIRLHEQVGEQNYESTRLQLIEIGDGTQKVVLEAGWRNQIISDTETKSEFFRFAEGFDDKFFQGRHFRFSIEDNIPVARLGSHIFRFESMESAYEFLSREDVASAAAVDLLDFMFLRHIILDQNSATTLDYRLGRKDSVGFEIEVTLPDSEGFYKFYVMRKIQGKHRLVTFQIWSSESGQKMFSRDWRETVFQPTQN